MLLESDVSILSKLAAEAGSSLESAQNDLQNMSDELAQLYHHVCTVNGETPSRVCWLWRCKIIRFYILYVEFLLAIWNLFTFLVDPLFRSYLIMKKSFLRMKRIVAKLNGAEHSSRLTSKLKISKVLARLRKSRRISRQPWIKSNIWEVQWSILLNYRNSKALRLECVLFVKVNLLNFYVNSKKILYIIYKANLFWIYFQLLLVRIN